MNNGKRHPQALKNAARQLRGAGFTHREITEKLDISLGSAHLWTRDILLTSEQKQVIQRRNYDKIFTKNNRQKLSEHARKKLSPFWYRPSYTTQTLLEKIKQFYLQNGRIPLKREFNMYHAYKDHFGSWNKAIVAAGFSPNKSIFTKRFTAEDGHICDSFSEKIIDDWLHKHSIPHQRNAKYGKSKMTADFAVGETRIEFFGLAATSNSYRKIMEQKRDFCAREGLRLLEIYPEDLYRQDPQKYLEILLKKLSS